MDGWKMDRWMDKWVEETGGWDGVDGEKVSE